MSNDDLTHSILREIRSEVRQTRTELAETRTELAETRAELKADIAATSDRLDDRLDGTNGRLAVVEATVRDFAAQHLMLTRYVKNAVERQGGRIDDLDERVEKIETKLGT